MLILFHRKRQKQLLPSLFFLFDLLILLSDLFDWSKLWKVMFFFYHRTVVRFKRLSFSIQGLNQGPKNKATVVGTASLNLAEYASVAEDKEFEIKIPLTLSTGAAEPSPQLCVCASCESFFFLSFIRSYMFFFHVIIIKLLFIL